MDLQAFKTLLTAWGQEALRAAEGMAPREDNFLQHLARLIRRFPKDLAQAALETAILRQEAATKFPFASQMYFTREAMEQASSWEVSAYRAQRYQPFPLLLDLGCSIGSDTIHMASLAPTLGIDRDPLRLAMAQANLRALELFAASVFLQADLRVALPVSHPYLALFFDPARRAAGKRAFSIHDYQPPLVVIRQWLQHFPALGVKTSPGVDLEELSSYAAEIEFISLRGELKEAVLWFGPLKTTHHRATLLPGPHSLAVSEPQFRHELSNRSKSLPLLRTPGGFLYEPDPAILRAGLVRHLAEQLEAGQLDTDIAYLTADRRVSTPFARAWPVEAWFPFSLKRLRSELHARHVNRVTVKKRGSPLQPEALIRELRLKPPVSEPAVERVIFLTHLDGKPIVICCLSEEKSSPV